MSSIHNLAHQGGWDETLMIVGPILAIIALLAVAKRKLNKEGKEAEEEEEEEGDREDLVAEELAAEDGVGVEDEPLAEVAERRLS